MSFIVPPQRRQSQPHEVWTRRLSDLQNGILAVHRASPKPKFTGIGSPDSASDTFLRRALKRSRDRGHYRMTAIERNNL